MNYESLRQFLAPGVLFVAATTGLTSVAQAYDVFTYACEIGKPTGWQAYSSSYQEYKVTYHIDLISKTYTSSLYKNPNKRYPIDSVRDDGSIRLFRNTDSKGYGAGSVTIHPEKGTYWYFLQDHNFQVSHRGTCKVIE